jgi:membrane protease YdiL (CAAX protease family)
VTRGEAEGSPPPRWGLGEAAVAFLVGMLLSAVAGQIAAAAVGYRNLPGQSLPLGVTIVSLVGLWTGLAGGALYAARARGSQSLVADFGFRVAGWGDLAGGVVVGLASQYLLVPAIYLPFEQNNPGLRHRLEQPARQDIGTAHGGAAVVLLIFLAVGAPIVEELFFRGLLQRALLRRLGAVPSVLGSATLFGLAHFEALQLPALIAFGIVLGVLAHRTARLGPGIFAHGAFNAVTVLTLTLRH